MKLKSSIALKRIVFARRPRISFWQFLAFLALGLVSTVCVVWHQILFFMSFFTLVIVLMFSLVDSIRGSVRHVAFQPSAIVKNPFWTVLFLVFYNSNILCGTHCISLQLFCRRHNPMTRFCLKLVPSLIAPSLFFVMVSWNLNTNFYVLAPSSFPSS